MACCCDAGLSEAEVACAGIGVAVIIFILGISGGIGLVNRFVHWPIVRGMQLGLGLSMAIKGVSLVQKSNTWWGLDSKLTAIVGAAIVLIGGYIRDLKTHHADIHSDARIYF